MRDPVLRNLEITHCYARLASAFAERNGPGANWCTYATWASRQAGRTIRGEDLADALERLLGTGRWLLHPVRTASRRLLRRGLFRPDTRLGRLTAELHTPFDAFELASAAVARGNLKVFEEIGLAFARFLDEGPAVVDSLRPGDPPDGQRYLRSAFRHYERLRDEADASTRAELAVLANLQIGLHEQTRLQSEIREALDAPYAVKQDLGRRAHAAVRRPASLPAGAFAAGVQRASSRVAREAITDALMTIALPGRVLALSRHLADEYPEALRRPANPELAELLSSVEPVPPARDDCGARDWSDLAQRMHYLAHLFRAFHFRDELSSPPFSEQQVATLAKGALPDGTL